MYTYRKQVLVNSLTPASTADYVIYQLDINSIATYKMADVEIITSLCTIVNTSTIYYRKLQIIDPAISPDYSAFPAGNSSFRYIADIAADLYLSEISYVQTGTNNGNIQIKTTNPTGSPSTGIPCFVHFKINFY
jgi:hypothetical protein